MRCTRWIAAAFLAAVAPACSKKAPEPKVTAPVAAAQPSTKTAAKPATEGDAGVIHGIRRLAYPDVPVFVDGKQLGVLRYGELPPSMKMIEKPGDETHDARYYRLTDYLKALGVSVDSVRAIHFAGKGYRLMSLEGSEIRAHKDRFLFDFAMKTAGLPREAWEFDGLKNTTWIDYIEAVYVYAKREVPAIDPEHHCYWLAGNEECDGVAPYSDEIAKGTRVYTDGKLVGYVKRRRIDDSMVVGKKEDGSTTYSLSAVVASFGVDLDKARAVELLAGDAVVARATREQWLASKQQLSFTLPKHGHGKVQALVPAELQLKDEGTKDRESIITAVEVYRSVDPSQRPMTALDEVPEVALSGDGQAQAALGSGEGRANEL